MTSPLLDRCDAAVAAADVLVDAAKRCVGARVKAAPGDSEQRAAHALSWYATYAEALRKAGDAYRRTLLTPRVRRLFDWYFSVMRRL